MSLLSYYDCYGLCHCYYAIVTLLQLLWTMSLLPHYNCYGLCFHHHYTVYINTMILYDIEKCIQWVYIQSCIPIVYMTECISLL